MTQRSPRLYDLGYLAWLRTRPCCICHKPPPSEACHIRMGSLAHNKRPTGMAEKPSDKWAVPMCSDHHRMQHASSEWRFWQGWQYDPFQMAILFYAEFGGDGGHPRSSRGGARRGGAKAGRAMVRQGMGKFPKTKRKIPSRKLR